MPSTSRLKKYLDTKKKPTVVLGKVERFLLSVPSDRDTTVLHPSEFTKKDWCPREGWFLLNGAQKPTESHSLIMQSVFAEGHYIHQKWQIWLEEAGLLADSEVPVVDHHFNIHGHADGILLVEGEYILLEIKSIGTGTLRANNFPIDGSLGKSFRNITRPFASHIRQAMVYAWILRSQSWPIERILFLYECKEDQFVREFTVKYDESYLDEVLPKLELLFPREDGVLVDSPPACANGSGCSCEAYS